MEESLVRAKMVIEAIYENLQAKQELFETLDMLLPADIPILSNTSGLRITDIASRVKNPGRTVTAHFWFPAHLVPLVEVVMGDQTDEAVAVFVKDTLAKWGKAPVLVRKDLPGQLANRILQAIIREAVNIVAMGLASPEDVDTAVKMGMGIRFPAWGPLEHIDAVGLDLAAAVQNTVLPAISSSTVTNRYLTELVNRGDLGYKTGKGIYDWSQKDMVQLARGRNEFIIYALKKIGKQ
jgi:3-hydroxybutyryl-CoA dehydrogenase